MIISSLLTRSTILKYILFKFIFNDWILFKIIFNDGSLFKFIFNDGIFEKNNLNKVNVLPLNTVLNTRAHIVIYILKTYSSENIM